MVLLMTGYGIIPLDEVLEITSEIAVSVKETDKYRLYTRLCREECEDKNIVLDKTITPLLEPVEPIYNPEPGIVNCLYIKLVNPVMVSPGKEIHLFLKLPVDIAVVNISDKNVRLIDMIPDNNARIALYGDPREGVLCRYTETTLVAEKDSLNISPGYAIARIIIVNHHKTPVTVSKIIVPLRSIHIYYKPGSWEAFYPDIKMSITGESTAVVSLSDEAPYPGLTVSRYRHLGLVSAGIMLEAGKYRMTWGF